MKVREIMTTDVSACQPDTNLAHVAKTMWDRDCGTLPVVTNEGRVMGMITDRDICIAVTTKGRTADRVSVREVSAGHVYSCLPDDDVSRALDTMKTRQVRRLPVVDEQGHLKGMLSLNDIALHTGRAGDAVHPMSSRRPSRASASTDMSRFEQALRNRNQVTSAVAVASPRRPPPESNASGRRTDHVDIGPSMLARSGNKASRVPWRLP